MTTKRNEDLTFGDFIKNYRLGEEMTQQELAGVLGISKQRVCDIEKNRSSVSLNLCQQIAESLELPPEWLAKLALQDQINNAGLRLKVS
ncbi:MAG: transcriptional regulator [Peredibacter sp.]|nr:transcriptional regulator [Peredibacter sp.]